ncbi:MAG: MFS transporter [Spirochaetales bacterium]
MSHPSPRSPRERFVKRLARRSPFSSRQSGLARRLRSRRLATGVMFFTNGALLGTWVAHIPEVQIALALGEGALGSALVVVPLGSFAIMPVGAWVIRTYGSRWATICGFLSMSAGVVLVVQAEVYAALIPAVALLGIGNGLMDVGMNAQGVIIERLRPGPIMSSLHGLFSVGNVAGAVAAGSLLEAGLLPEYNGPIIAAALFVATVPFVFRLVPARSGGESAPAPAPVAPEEPAAAYSSAESGEEASSSVRGGTTLALVVLSAVAFANLIGEGTMNDWSAVYIRNALGGSALVASSAYSAFAFAMAVGRFSGDRVIAAVGRGWVLGGGLALAGVGLLLATSVNGLVPAFCGFALAGLGLANGIPIAFGAGGRLRSVRAGNGIAVVMGAAYAGGLVTPPAVGFVAEAVGLPLTFAGVGVVLLVAALGSRQLPDEE